MLFDSLENREDVFTWEIWVKYPKSRIAQTSPSVWALMAGSLVLQFKESKSVEGKFKFKVKINQVQEILDIWMHYFLD